MDSTPVEYTQGPVGPPGLGKTKLVHPVTTDKSSESPSPAGNGSHGESLVKG